MVNQKLIAEAVEAVVIEVENKNNDMIARSLVGLVHTADGEGLNAEQTHQILLDRGIEGGDFLKQFINEQFENLNSPPKNT